MRFGQFYAPSLPGFFLALDQDVLTMRAARDRQCRNGADQLGVPRFRRVQRVGNLAALRVLGALHDHYVRV